uniref:Uncharacterized protein n=1 Tax=Timema monikensis TaxID=170555 RepID=A0A7R9DYX2_9NEOP|nr:unnamed protein product [Timema monikensis]
MRIILSNLLFRPVFRVWHVWPLYRPPGASQLKPATAGPFINTWTIRKAGESRMRSLLCSSNVLQPDIVRHLFDIRETKALFENKVTGILVYCKKSDLVVIELGWNNSSHYKYRSGKIRPFKVREFTGTDMMNSPPTLLHVNSLFIPHPYCGNDTRGSSSWTRDQHNASSVGTCDTNNRYQTRLGGKRRTHRRHKRKDDAEDGADSDPGDDSEDESRPRYQTPFGGRMDQGVTIAINWTAYDENVTLRGIMLQLDPAPY